MLDEHLKTAPANAMYTKTAPANAMYTSKTIQNQLISICGTILEKKFVMQ